MPPLTAPGRRRADYPLQEKVAADRAQLAPSHALSLVAAVHLRTAALHSDEAGGSMQLAQAAKEKMHAPVFSLAASAAAAATTKSEGTNPIPQPDVFPGQHVFFKTNPIPQLAQNSQLGYQLPTAILYQGLGSPISNTVTGFAHPVYDSRVRPRCTGKERDAESGRDFFEARYYSGAQGRFTSADEPLAYQYESDPQTWNLYTYGRNNPLKFVDPDGHEPCVNGVNPENGNICVVHTEKPKSDDVPLTPYAQEFYNQMSNRRQASNGLIAGFAIADAVLATTYLGTYVPALLIRAAPAAAAALPVLSGTNAQKLRQAGEFVARMEGSFQDKVTAMVKLLDQIKGSGNWNYTAMDAADGAKVFFGDATNRIRVIDTAGKVWSGTVEAMNGLTPDYSKLTPVK
jgi:RHS repeat-associated protein